MHGGSTPHLLLRLVALLHLDIENALLFISLGNKARAFLLVRFEFPEAVRL
jgi:hypothetical protein